MTLFNMTHSVDTGLSFALGLFIALSIFTLLSIRKKTSESTQ